MNKQELIAKIIKKRIFLAAKKDVEPAFGKFDKEKYLDGGKSNLPEILVFCKKKGL